LFPCCGQLEGPDCEKCVVNDQHIYEDFDTFAEKLTIVKTPEPFPGIQKRKAVALDCEMGTSYTNSSELIQLCVVDYFTGESLIDMLVRPKVQLRSFNTRYSGVTREMMAQAIATGEYLDGVEGARNELWKWIDSTTVLIGHSLHCDLRELRLAHPLVVDSLLCVPKINASGNGLKTLIKELLGQKVQDSKSGHDCMEDALASRELVIWCIQNEDRVAERAIISQKEEEIRRQEREANNILKEERLRLKLEQEQLDSGLESSHSSSAPIPGVGETGEHDLSYLHNAYHSQGPSTWW
jgi:DNA polymerase III epsilon subunit-like protein